MNKLTTLFLALVLTSIGSTVYGGDFEVDLENTELTWPAPDSDTLLFTGIEVTGQSEAEDESVMLFVQVGDDVKEVAPKTRERQRGKNAAWATFSYEIEAADFAAEKKGAPKTLDCWIHVKRGFLKSNFDGEVFELTLPPRPEPEDLTASSTLTKVERSGETLTLTLTIGGKTVTVTGTAEGALPAPAAAPAQGAPQGGVPAAPALPAPPTFLTVDDEDRSYTVHDANADGSFDLGLSFPDPATCCRILSVIGAESYTAYSRERNKDKQGLILTKNPGKNSTGTVTLPPGTTAVVVEVYSGDEPMNDDSSLDLASLDDANAVEYTGSKFNKSRPGKVSQLCLLVTPGPTNAKIEPLPK